MAEQRARRTRPTAKPSKSRSRSVSGPQAAAERACQSLGELLAHPAEGVSAICRAEEGWRVSVDVLEVPRIPDTTSLLATYEVDIDGAGELLQYRRVRRYRRGSADE
ncbi:gas vesicle protein [Streptomyces sp. NA04227]|uniref:gas vesicle protein GvpO n=1 Tax=Streptomyces sp. NA04227 TaxID=2742136 RepID=UPI001590C6DF|nr:gas vesicle protein [Streptomyces sp. NA04227]QKW09987.1 gas vesicle protein [Streptomyces sp. NA04227]